MKKIKRNIRFKNSKGISDKEYLLKSTTGRAYNRETLSDFDYLDKLSPEEFAWLAEVMVSDVTGMEADARIVGEETAQQLNNNESRHKAWNGEYSRRKSIHNRETYQINEEILNVADCFSSQWMEADANIERSWRARRKKEVEEKLKNIG